MRRLPLLACLMAGWCLSVGLARAEAPPDPLRLVPDQADLVIKVERPRALVEMLLNLDLVKQLQTLDAVQEAIDSTNVRRFYQLIAYFEKELGASWPELVERLAGGGVVVATKVGSDPAPALLVVQSKDEATLRKFVKTLRTLVEQELARQDAKERVEQGTYRDRQTLKIGGTFHAALAGSALLVSNNEKALQLALDCHLDGKKSLADVPRVAEARKMLPADSFAWLGLNFDSVRKLPNVKEALNPEATEPIQQVLFGGWLDQFRRAPFLCAGLVPNGNGLSLTWRTPCGREGMPEGTAGLHTPSAELGGALPLLEPKGVLFSMSYVLDLKQLWDQRAKLFNAKQIKQLEDFDKTSGKFLAGNRFSWLLTQAGPHQRLVVAHQTASVYQKKPEQRLPAFAFIVDMREAKDFSRTMETALRSAALLGNFSQLKLKLVEEKHGDLTIVGYRFPEDQSVENDAGDIRFNFSPCFVAAGNQYIIASTVELARELVDIVQREAKQETPKSQAAMQLRVYPAGAADFLQTVEDRLLAATILDRALAPREAKDQVKRFIDLVRGSGVLELEQVYGANDFRYDIRYAPRKAK